jgi:uncharacterized protein
MSETFIQIVAVLLIAPGIVMAFVPFLPALSYMLMVALVFSVYDKFQSITPLQFGVLALITMISIVVDHTAGVMGAKYGGAHIKSLFWGLGASILGTFLFPGLGTFLGLFLGVLVAEIYYKKPQDQALKAAGSALLGSAIGVGVNIVLALVFICLFSYFVFL